MYNAVNDTSEKLSTEPNGDSICDECLQELKFSKAEGPRTASKHFASKKHKLARKKALKPLVLERTHTSNDMYRVLGLPTFAEKIKASSLTPKADRDGHLVGLACECGKLLEGSTVFMVMGNLRKHTCVTTATQKRRLFDSGGQKRSSNKKGKEEVAEVATAPTHWQT